MKTTEKQFSALAKLLRLRRGPAQAAAELVIVRKVTVSDAAKIVGLDYKSAHQAVQRAKAGLALARKCVVADGDNQ